MTQRHDDVEALIAKAEQESTGKRTAKIKQSWAGLVGVHVVKGHAQLLADAINSKMSRAATWKANEAGEYSVVTNGDNWVSFFGLYVAKGANANDAEKLVIAAAEAAQIQVLEIAIDTRAVIPV